MYQCGYLQRDVSIGNIQKLVRPRLYGKPFTTKGVRKLLSSLLDADVTADLVNIFESLSLDDTAGNEATWDELKRVAGNDPDVLALLDEAHRLEVSLAKYGVSNECKAIISDGDMAVYIPTYFTDEPHRGEISASLLAFLQFLDTDR